MTRQELDKVQAQLRKMFANPRILLVPPVRPKGTVELHIGEEFVGTVHRDAEDGEVSYSIQIVVLAEDLA